MQFNGHVDEDSADEADSESEASEEEDSDADSDAEDKVVDNVRIMARAEERIARAATKSAMKQAQQKDKSSKDASTAEPVAKSRKTKKAEEEARTSKNLNRTTAAEEEEDNEYFETIVEARASDANPNNVSASQGGGQNGQILFTQLSLSRPLLRAVERTGYTSATPIQAQTIPYALAGKDICASAETGSGKTAGEYSKWVCCCSSQSFCLSFN